MILGGGECVFCAQHTEVSSHVLGCGYIGAGNDTTLQAEQTTEKEVEMQNITLYVSGCTETDSTGMLFPRLIEVILNVKDNEKISR